MKSSLGLIIVISLLLIGIFFVIKCKYYDRNPRKFIDPYQEEKLDTKYKELATAIYRHMKNNPDRLTEPEQNFVNEVVIIHYGPDGVWRKYGSGLDSIVRKYELQYLLPENISKIY